MIRMHLYNTITTQYDAIRTFNQIARHFAPLGNGLLIL